MIGHASEQKQDTKASGTPGGANGAQAPNQAGAAKKSELRSMSYAEGANALAPPAAQAAEKKGDAKKDDKPKLTGNYDPGNRIGALHPAFQTKVYALLALCQARGLDVFVTQGMRTFAEQNELYKQGRTKKGAVVTWARGGQSYHNYGLAVDFAFHGKNPYSESHDWAGLVKAVTDSGLESGASYGDRPHANLKGISIKTLQGWHAKGGIANVWNQVSNLLGGPKTDVGGEEKDGGETRPGSAPSGTYKVKPGDTLIRIAQTQLGNGDKWKDIASLNGIKDAGSLQVGQILKLPKQSANELVCKLDEDSCGDQENTFKETTYTVRPGDALTVIALRMYGMSSLWTEIAMANQIKDPTSIKPGQKLVIPVPGKKPADVKQPVPITHLVGPGDTLIGLAKQYLKDGERWKEIAKENGIQDPRKLRLGQKLKIPA